MQKIYLCLAGRMVPSIKFILVFLIMGMGGKGWGQTISWEHPGNITAWYSSGNWNPITSSIDWLPNNIAQFNNTGIATTCGIDMNTRALSIGAVELSALRKRNLTIGNLSSTSAPLTLNGATVNSVPNCILRNASASLLSIQNNEFGISNFMGIVLANATNNIINTDSTGDITIGCIISGSKPLTKSGTGTGVLNLSAGNIYTGKTFINSSFINATGESAFGINPAGFVADQITLNGGGIQTSLGDIIFLSNRGITLGASGGTFDVANTTTITALNVVTGAGALNITGSGTGLLLMSGQHTYTGITTITSGTLQLNCAVGNTIPSTNNVIINGGTLNITTNQILNNLDINTAGTLNVTTGVTLTINGTLTYNGGIINTTGTIVYGSTGKLIYGGTKTSGIEWTNTNTPSAVTLNNSAIVTLANNATTSGNLTINNTSNLTGTGYTLTVGGNWNSTSTNSSTGYSGGNNLSSNVVFNGTGIRSIVHTGGVTFKNLNIIGTGYYTAYNNIIISVYTLNISNGTLDMLVNSLSGSGNLTMSNGLLKLAKLSTTLPELTGAFSIIGGTIELNGAGPQVLKGGQDYRNLTFSGNTYTTLASNPNSIKGSVYITGSSVLNIGSSNVFGDGATNLIMDGGRFKMSGSGSDKPDIDGNYNLTGGVIEFAGSSLGAQPIKGKTLKGATNIIYKSIEVTGTNVGTGNYNIFLNQNAGNFVVKGPDGVYAPNTKSIISENNVNTSSVTIENGAMFKIGNNQGFSGTTYTVPSNSAIDNNISGSRIFLNQGSSVDYAGASAQIISNKIPYQNFVISATTAVNKTAPGSAGGDLIILGNITKATGSTFVANGGTVSLEGTLTQIYSGTGSMEFYTIVNKNTTGGFTVSNDFGVVNQLKINSSAKLTFGSGNINLRSSATQTCNIPDLGTINMPTIDYTGTGRFQIERFLRARSSWRLLATPVEISSSASITNSWREGELVGTNTVSQYGTRITGPTGMDEFTQRSSMKSYNGNNNNYVEVNTPAKLAGPIANNEGYYIFVRGDRTVGVGGLGTTTLRIRGKIRTGDQTFSVPANILPSTGFQSIGNPYPSAIDFRLIDKKNIAESYYIWNPDSLGNFGVGKFEQYALQGTHYTKTPGGDIRDSIQSGEAFFVQSITGGTVIIKESYKVGGSKLVSREEISTRTGVTNPTIEINLHAINANQTLKLVDGVKINFDGNFSNGIDNNDIRKINNSVDNLSIKIESKNLIVERRPTLTATDTIFLSLTNTRVALYRFEIDPSVLGNLPLNGYLIDKFLKTETQVSLTDVTNVNFNITTDAASNAADRFMIVFKTAIAPGQFTGNFITIDAKKNSDKINTIKWSYSNELNIAHYSVERSDNGTVFTGIGNKNAGNLSNIGSYIFKDSLNVFGTNYYRVKATSTTGLVQYSAVVKVVENDSKPFFVVHSNPVVNKTLHIIFENMQGNNTIKLLAKNGVTIFTKQFMVLLNKEVKNISVGAAVALGIYDVVIVSNSGKIISQSIYIQ